MINEYIDNIKIEGDSVIITSPTGTYTFVDAGNQGAKLSKHSGSLSDITDYKIIEVCIKKDTVYRFGLNTYRQALVIHSKRGSVVWVWNKHNYTM